MQAVYSTATDVKIHQAIRREWASFQAWLFEQHRRLEYREHEILSAAQRRWGKMKNTDKEQIQGMQREFLDDARREWLARVRQSQLHLEHWVMTPDEKHMLQQTLGWTHKDMVDAYAKEQAEMGPMYQRVDPGTLGTNEPSQPMASTSRFMHPKAQDKSPAYTHWASELAKMSAASLHRSPRSPKSVELPGMPLYFVGALLQGTDLDAVAASDLEAFAVRISEEKIREYYSEACEAALHFQRFLPTLEPSKREAAQADFERRMRDLAGAKEREWKTITVKELRRHQAAEMERRAAQQRAMRPPPRRPPRREFRDEFRDWDFINSPQSSRRDYFHTASPQSSRRDYFNGYQSPQSEYLESYHSPRPRPRRVRQRPVRDDEYARGRGWIRSLNLAHSPFRIIGARAVRAPTDWSKVRVDEVDLKPRVHAAKTRHGNDVVVRLDGAPDDPRPAKREKLRKRRSENVDTTAATTAAPKSGQRMGGSGPGRNSIFGRRVSDTERKIAVAGKAHLPPQADQPHPVGHRVDGPGFGLAVGKGGTRAEHPRKRGEVPGTVSNLSHALKHVRFTPSAGTGSVNKRAAMRRVNTNDSQSKFYEVFGSKANSAMS